MLRVNSFDEYVSTRMLDFFGTYTSWQRRLWNVGTVLGIKEVLEGSEAVQSGVLSESAFGDLCATVEAFAGTDPGVGSTEQHQLLQRVLHSKPRTGSVDFLLLQELLTKVETDYLHRWARVLAENNDIKNAERTARSIGSHLLDSGFSPIQLHHWLSYKIKHEQSEMSLSEFVTAPRSRAVMAQEWRDAKSVSEWLKSNGFDVRNIRQGGGILLQISARDPWAAMDQVLEIVERLRARISIGTRAELTLFHSAWIQGQSKPYPLERTRRGVEVHALDRENQLYTQNGAAKIDAALELIAPLDVGPPGPAVAGGWAALETLMLGPGDASDRRIAGDRLASLVACSFPRAELTALAHAHALNATDNLANRLRNAATNRDRAALIASAIGDGASIVLKEPSDRIAATRIKSLLTTPRATLLRIETHLRQTLRRFYRQRNLVLHWGRVNAVSLNSALRTAAPVIGAGIDRVVHASFVEQTNPLELTSRARLHLDLLGTSDGHGPVDLLEGK
jgi:hypothetical protein